MSTPPFEFRPSGMIDFDPVPPDAGAKPAAAKSEDPIDRDPLAVTFGGPKDRKPGAAERMLAGATIDWLVAFADGLRPKALCEAFPHVANRLAHEWADPQRSAASLRLLADDARWGSAGYPAKVQGELNRLLQALPGAR